MSTVSDDFITVIDFIISSMGQWVAIISAQWLLQVVILIALIGFVISSIKDGSKDKKGGNK